MQEESKHKEPQRLGIGNIGEKLKAKSDGENPIQPRSSSPNAREVVKAKKKENNTLTERTPAGVNAMDLL